jgi:hypothetical protein
MKTQKPKKPMHWTPAMAVMASMEAERPPGERPKDTLRRQAKAIAQAEREKRMSIRQFIAGHPAKSGG